MNLIATAVKGFHLYSLAVTPGHVKGRQEKVEGGDVGGG